MRRFLLASAAAASFAFAGLAFAQSPEPVPATPPVETPDPAADAQTETDMSVAPAPQPAPAAAPAAADMAANPSAVCAPRTTSVQFGGRSGALDRENQNAIEYAVDAASVCDLQQVVIEDSGAAAARRAQAVRALLIRQGVPADLIAVQAGAAGANDGRLDVRMTFAGVARADAPTAQPATPEPDAQTETPAEPQTDLQAEPETPPDT